MGKFAQKLCLRCISAGLATGAMTTYGIAGAWPQPEGETEAIVSVAHSLAHRAFDPTGNAVSQGRFRKIETQIYTEHGLTDHITLVGEVARSTDKTEAFNRQFTDTSFRRVELGARAYLFTWEDTRYSLECPRRPPRCIRRR